MISTCLGQSADMTEGVYTDLKTGISFTTWTSQDGFTTGLVLPPNAAGQDAVDYIGLLRCESDTANATGWCGLAHHGDMLADLLLIAWQYQGSVVTSFRWATDYFMPPAYVGQDVSLTQISSWANSTGYEVIYRCRNCLPPKTQPAAIAKSAKASKTSLPLGYAQGFDSPLNPGCPGNVTFTFHDKGYGEWEASLVNTEATLYDQWALLATKVQNDTC
ncbi:hypothetical protein B0T26DRAFT_651469 [Lasiosphaeria miniovina]|uniref:Cellobiose dehydrogenase-like cytochrome domain-containing protein n=1 Tax=Lasiosphaeria miniovina TaxID=1954250 RepID=A0AA40ABS7_9PEZI|nr:uncharacterized protein B0T26DRAFT_651469 [Lasiosphaeria miniovina]KAK0712966.1 hypothetical protein B0T26DRAFT_651469 [Lasiosphaeria miniovina]